MYEERRSGRMRAKERITVRAPVVQTSEQSQAIGNIGSRFSLRFAELGAQRNQVQAVPVPVPVRCYLSASRGMKSVARRGQFSKGRAVGTSRIRDTEREKPFRVSYCLFNVRFDWCGKKMQPTRTELSAELQAMTIPVCN